MSATATLDKPVAGTLIPDQALKEQGRKWARGIEAFAVGKWNWAKYHKDWTPSDLAGMAEAFKPTLAELEPVITTNHGEDADQGKNRGFIGRIYTNPQAYRDDEGRMVPAGHRLLMDALVDADLYEDMQAAKYRRPSVELFQDYKSTTGKTYPWVVTCASIQGGKHLEAVRVLKPIARTLAAQLHFSHGGTAIVVNFDSKETTRMDEESKALLQQILAAVQAVLKAQQADTDQQPAMQSEDPSMPGKDDDKPKLAAAVKTDIPITGAGSPMVKHSEQPDPEKEKLRKDLDSANKMIFEERSLRLRKERENAAAEFVAAQSNTDVYRIPKQAQALAVRLHAGAEEAALKFSDGKTWRQTFEEFCGLLHDGKAIFQEHTQTIVDVDEGGLEAMSDASAEAQVSAKVRQLFKQDGGKGGAVDANKGVDAMAEVFSKNPRLYEQYRKEVQVKV